MASSHPSGFTLIETIIYALLTTLILGFAVFTLYNIIKASDHLKGQAEVNEEINFIMQKINWALAGATAINLPVEDGSGSVLSITKSNFAQNPIVFDLANGDVRIKLDGGSAKALDDDVIVVSQIMFERLPQSVTIPPGIKTTITLHHSNYSSTTLSVINYLRK